MNELGSGGEIRRRVRRVAPRVLGVVLVAAAAAGCETGRQPDNSGTTEATAATTTTAPVETSNTNVSTTTVKAANQSVMLTPDLSGFTYPGDSSRCLNGGLRPCAAGLRPQPKLTSQPAIASANNLALYPFEAYKQGKGDKLKVVCQVLGELVNQTTDTSVKSSIWDVVEVAVSVTASNQVDRLGHINPETIDKANKANPEFGVVKDGQGNVTNVYVYANDLWLGNNGVMDALPTCSNQQNPKHYEAVV